MKRVKDGRGLLVAHLVTVGHVPLELSKLCYYFMRHNGEISGVVEDSRHRRSPKPSGGLEVKLKLTFKGLGDIVYKMKQLIREAYTWHGSTLENNPSETNRSQSHWKKTMKKKSIYDFDFTSNMILSIFSNIEFLFVKKKRTVKKATNTLI